LNRYLANNYWDCPIPYYSRSNNDYLFTKSQCGKQFLRFYQEWKNEKIIRFKKLDSSCPTNKCLNGGKCSTRLNGKFYCQCPLPSSGTQCESG